MKTIKEKHFIVEYVIPESLEEENEIKKIIREVYSDRNNIDMSKFVIDKPENRD